MGRCHYCAWGGSQHDPACPHDNRMLIHWWQTGYDDARAGNARRLHPVETRDRHIKAYDLGYHQGEIALEATQNGHDAG